MTLKEYLLWRFKQYHTGKKRSVKRIELLGLTKYANTDNRAITDREMRQAYEDLPICGGLQGLYLPETQDEIDEQIELHMKKVYAYWRKIKILREYKIESDPIQKDLF